jgi:antitoxin (DNA-binding transcriptional repressor) of toxin-antitoxin stability system
VIIMAMKRISIQALKSRLSSAIAEAEAGETILVTRHNRAVAELGPTREAHVHRGKSVGKGGLKPAIKEGTGGRYLAVLAEDRGDR